MPSFSVGLDLGSAADYSALAVVERVFVLPKLISLGQWHRQPDMFHGALVEQLHVRHLRRWELQTPYPVIVADVAAFMRTQAMRRDGILVIDGSGVGAAVRDLFWQAHVDDPLGCYRPQAIMATGGHQANGLNVPKKDLMASVQTALQLGQLKVAESPLAESLEKELTSFRLKISQTGRELFDYQRSAGEGHGDIVSALALALYMKNTLRRPEVIEWPFLRGENNHE